MFDDEAQTRIRKCCSDAAIGYMTAANAAYAALADEAFRFWSQSLDAMTPTPVKPAKKSWYVVPDQPGGRRLQDQDREQTGAWACMMPWMAAASSSGAGGPFAGSAGAWGLLDTWAEFMNPKNAMAWPMACGMMAFGIPQSVAWPAAQANVAAMDAFQTAAKSVEEAVVSYRSEGGHAVASVVSAR